MCQWISSEGKVNPHTVTSENILPKALSCIDFSRVCDWILRSHLPFWWYKRLCPWRPWHRTIFQQLRLDPIKVRPHIVALTAPEYSQHLCTFRARGRQNSNKSPRHLYWEKCLASKQTCGSRFQDPRRQFLVPGEWWREQAASPMRASPPETIDAFV